MLYGDDDTFWFIDNALVYLSQLDPDMPYLLSDNIWMKERNSGMWTQILRGFECIVSADIAHASNGLGSEASITASSLTACLHQHATIVLTVPIHNLSIQSDSCCVQRITKTSGIRVLM